MKLVVETEVKFTEDKEKVLRALKNIFPSINFLESGSTLKGESEDPTSLERFKELLRKQAIRDASRVHLMSRIEGNVLRFMLNKQAAFCGKVNFTDGESPLGPIVVTIESENLVELIRSLTS